ncbi:MAG: hypothetical protein WCB11_28565, partial [Terriglobales bacterium]
SAPHATSAEASATSLPISLSSSRHFNTDPAIRTSVLVRRLPLILKNRTLLRMVRFNVSQLVGGANTGQ